MVAQPAPPQRIVALDALRGVALVGILVVNLFSFGGLFALTPDQMAAMPTAAVDGVLFPLIGVFFVGKFYSIFSLLFGIGFAIQLARGGAGRFRRRMVVLLLIGLVHSLLWYGDILVLYAVLGLLLVPASRRCDATLLRLAVLVLLLPAVSWLVFNPLMEFLGKPAMWPFHGAGPRVEATFPLYDAAMLAGNLPELLRTNVEIWVHERLVYFLTSGRPYRVLSMFLLGLWIGRQGFHATLAEHRPALRRIARWGFLLGVPLSAVGITLAYIIETPLNLLVDPFAVPILALGIAAMVGLLITRPEPPRWLLSLAPLGRIALTAYLSQTAICLLLFSGLVTGWYAQLGVTAVVAVTVPVILLQVAFATWWLARYPQGPMERLWRWAAGGGGGEKGER